MRLPGRLRSTTLGDLLGTLYRGSASGILELTEDRGRTHRVYLIEGLVVAVEVDGASPTLAEVLRADQVADDTLLKRSLLRAMASQRLHGDVLTHEFNVSPAVVGDALRRQVIARLSLLEQMADARVGFRVAARPPRGALVGRGVEPLDGVSLGPLKPRDFLYGRRRARERAGTATAPARPAQAWVTLGLTPGAKQAEIRQAYRKLAHALHPDCHPNATEEERRSLQMRFAQVTEAYRSLT